MRDTRLYFEDILRACKLILEFVEGQSFEDFEFDEKTKSAVVRQFEIVGVASRQLPESVRQEHRQIPWNAIIGMRNVLSHGYFGVDERALWDTVHKNVPVLRDEVARILEKYSR